MPTAKGLTPTTDSPSSIETIIGLFLHRVRKSHDQTAIHVKTDGTWQPKSWREIEQDVYRMASLLDDLGIRPGDRVAQWSENRYEWIVTDLATQACQAIHVPLHAPLSGPQAFFQISHSGATVAVVSGSTEIDKLQPFAAELSGSLALLTHQTCERQLGSQPIESWKGQVPDGAMVRGQEIAQAAFTATAPETVATILYTSGTTGEPKGVTLSQRNVISNVLAVLSTFDETESDLRLCFLPLSHIFARTCDLYTWIGSGAQLALAESRETIVADCQTIRPTIINGVPYFYEKIQNSLVAAGAATMPGALQQLLGDRVRACCSGGAALPGHTFDFFEEHGIPILQGYGLTETAPVLAMSTVALRKRGTVGPPLSGVDIQIAEDGEILARGPNIMLGYWRDNAATDAAMVDGWFHTGDLGELDGDGFLKITGRKKELIVTATGKNIAPSLLESLLCRDPLIEQAMVLGDDEKYIAALIVPNRVDLAAELTKIDSVDGVLEEESLWTNETVRDLFRERIQHQLRDLAHHEQVGRFVLLGQGFTVEAGHLTPKGSLRRETIERDFSTEIERLYRL